MELLESGQKAIQLSRIRPKANRTFEIRPKGEGTFREPDQKSMGLLRVRPKVDWCTDGNTVSGCDSDKNSLVIIYMS